MSVSSEDLVAFLLISTWALATGRRLRSDVPPGELTESELIEFWADDHLWPALQWDDRFPRRQRRGILS
jgi:hypothetical protein